VHFLLAYDFVRFLKGPQGGDRVSRLVNAADEIGSNRRTILNLHSILANNLLPNEDAASN
jgi:hypothetical protein